jgi:hypothetical protein
VNLEYKGRQKTTLQLITYKITAHIHMNYFLEEYRKDLKVSRLVLFVFFFWMDLKEDRI